MGQHRILPRSLLGITAMLVAFALGAGFSGAVLYSFYQYRLNQTDARVNTLIGGYKKQFANAEGDLAAARSRAGVGISGVGASTSQAGLVAKLARSLFFVSTQTSTGQPSVGTAFVVASDATESLLLTSYTTVQAATVTPGPAVLVRQGPSGGGTKVTVRTWDASLDLALIVLPKGNLSPLTPAPSTPAPQLGQTVFAVSGLGSAGGSVSAGQIDDVSSVGLALGIPLGPAFQGAPVIDASGQVLAVASRTYSPLGFPPSGVWYAPFVNSACSKVLTCPSGVLGGG